MGDNVTGLPNREKPEPDLTGGAHHQIAPPGTWLVDVPRDATLEIVELINLGIKALEYARNTMLLGVDEMTTSRYRDSPGSTRRLRLPAGSSRPSTIWSA
jgi:hypothetical protein